MCFITATEGWEKCCEMLYSGDKPYPLHYMISLQLWSPAQGQANQHSSMVGGRGAWEAPPLLRSYGNRDAANGELLWRTLPPHLGACRQH